MGIIITIRQGCSNRASLRNLLLFNSSMPSCTTAHPLKPLSIRQYQLHRLRKSPMPRSLSTFLLPSRRFLYLPPSTWSLNYCPISRPKQGLTTRTCSKRPTTVVYSQTSLLTRFSTLTGLPRSFRLTRLNQSRKLRTRVNVQSTLSEQTLNLVSLFVCSKN